MSAVILDGKVIAQKRLAQLAEDLKKEGAGLTLASVRVGDAKDAELYSRAIDNLAKKAGFTHLPQVYGADRDQTKIGQQIGVWNRDKKITGILVFAPLPKGVDSAAIINAIDVSKDVEGRRLTFGGIEPAMPCTALAAFELVKETGRKIEGAEAVVVGRSDVVGKPAAMLLIQAHATVTVCHSKTADLKAHVSRADIVIAAAGKAGLIKGDWIKPGAVVVDVGENVVNGTVVGDVDFESAKARAGFITPVPGGVGPMTNIALAYNLLRLHKIQKAAHADR